MMSDEFDKKRDVVKHLLGMLKSNAVGEVESHMKPKHEVSMEKISVKPGESVSDGAQMAKGGMVDLSLPNADQMEPASCDHAMCMGGACKYAEGGVVDEAGPEREIESDLVSQEGTGHEGPNAGFEDPAKNHETSVEDEDEENNQSAFMGLMKRRK